MRHGILVVGLVGLVALHLACAAAPERPAPIESVPRGDAARAVDAGPAIAPGHRLARVHALFEECSGLGGLHVIFEVLDERGARWALGHHGGHGYRAEERFRVGDLYEVVYTGGPRRDEDHDANPDSSRAGWCLDGMPRTDGRAAPVRRISPPRPSTR
jgi:hypothetical protein